MSSLSRLEVSIPTASSDGRYYGRYPKGNAPILAAAAAAASIAAGTLSSADFTTNFPLTENPISQGGIWVLGGNDGGGSIAGGTNNWNNPLTTGGHAAASVAMPAPNRYSDDIAHLKTSYRTFTANQYAQGTVYKAAGYTGNGGSHELELLLRAMISSGSAVTYEVLWGIQGYIAVVRWLGGVGLYQVVYTDNSFVPYNDGDVLRAEIVGLTLTVKRNGSIISGLSALDLTRDQGGNTVPAINNGQPGFGFWPADGGVPASAGWKSYSAGNL